MKVDFTQRQLEAIYACCAFENGSVRRYGNGDAGVSTIVVDNILSKIAKKIRKDKRSKIDNDVADFVG